MKLICRTNNQKRYIVANDIDIVDPLLIEDLVNKFIAANNIEIDLGNNARQYLIGWELLA